MSDRGVPRWVGVGLGVGGSGALMAAALAYGLRGSPEPEVVEQAASEVVAERLPEESVSQSPGLAFSEVSDTGIDAVYRNGEETGALAILESLGGGVAVFDFDRDGRPDLFFPGGGRIVPSAEDLTVEGLPGRLYRNLGDWRFADVTEDAGLDDASRYSHGCAVGDFDNDGFPDLLVTAYQGVTLYRNTGGTFVDVTEAAGLTEPGWATSAAWLDADGDGLLDLYVARYVDWSPEHNPPCRYHSSGAVDLCSPSVFDPLRDLLYRNRGDGTFEEIGREVGLDDGGKGLGVVAADLDGDRWIDVYVANDTTPNLLYRNRRDGTFEEIGQLSGAALSAEGVATGSMGVAAGDLDGDGDLDLFVTNYEGEINEFYRNDGAMQFVPVGLASGLGAASRPLVGWGTVLVDGDGDGVPEVLIANGHLMHHLPGTPRPQPTLLFRREPDATRFEPMRWGPESWFSQNRDARGVASGDLDGDGDPDLIVVLQNAPASVLRNDSAESSRFLRLRLEGTRSNRSAIGATVIVTAGDRSQHLSVVGGGSYLSQNDAPLVVGLGTAAIADQVEVRWPSGQTDRHDGLQAGSAWLLREGEPAQADPIGVD
ncbi:CRTAC1 family protein [Tautonia marina]|uniref:CRTAC1 family protein n=1 Tax=Tautonia marina TaxID=2653855 RepID=UPI001260F93D|nr:CRTAC1 family protein [Tautonia marina]